MYFLYDRIQDDSLENEEDETSNKGSDVAPSYSSRLMMKRSLIENDMQAEEATDTHNAKRPKLMEKSSSSLMAEKTCIKREELFRIFSLCINDANASLWV